MVSAVTPRKITKPIRSLCKRIAPDQDLIFLDVTPIENSEPLDCFVNVDRQIKNFGGEVLYGWQIWEWPTNMVEAEFHAIWISPQGKYTDITPKPIPVSRILFLPDPTKTYNGRQVNNIRMPLRDDPILEEFIDVSNEIFEYMNSGELVDYYGPVVVPERLGRRKEYLLEKINSRKIGHGLAGMERRPCAFH